MCKSAHKKTRKHTHAHTTLHKHTAHLKGAGKNGLGERRANKLSHN